MNYLPSLLLAMALPAFAIPNQVFGPVIRAQSPLNGKDLTDELLAAELWKGKSELPGTWHDDAPIATVRSSYLLARPKVFGLTALLVSATHRSEKLDGLAVTFADAGSYFGYFDSKLPAGLSRREKQAEIQRLLQGRQEKFRKEFEETLTSLQAALEKHSTGKRPRENPLGKTRTLRAEVSDYEAGDLVFRLLVGEERLIRVLIMPRGHAGRAWLDRDLAALDERDRLRLFRSHVRKTDRGDVLLEGLSIIPQGYKPYCGLNTLTMAARYFGLHLDEDWLAVAGQFRNTGSAAGSNIPRLYLAVAKEAGLDLTKANRFNVTDARRSLDAGLPVIVWRRFSTSRNSQHTRQSTQAERDPKFRIPAPDQAERATWPGKDAPLHASILTGYNRDRNELLFLESWAGGDKPRRMHDDEMEATAYLTFYFKP